MKACSKKEELGQVEDVREPIDKAASWAFMTAFQFCIVDRMFIFKRST